jgi:hypothetical protein
MSGWVTFTREFVRTSEPSVTISTLGRIAINNASAELLRTAKADLVHLRFNKGTHQVGIQPAKKGEKGTYKPAGNGGTGTNRGVGFSAVTFLNFINYDWSKTRSFPTEWTDGMLVFTIPEEHLKGRPGGPMSRRKAQKVE